MNPLTANWPCPACAELIPADHQSCPHCRLPADWVDLLRALDFAVRRFHLWKLEGASAPHSTAPWSSRAVISSTGWCGMARAGQSVPDDTGLPPRCSCWSCELTCHPSADHRPDCAAPSIRRTCGSCATSNS